MIAPLDRQPLRSLTAAVIVFFVGGMAGADPMPSGRTYTVVAGSIVDANWSVDYQRILAGNPVIADAINRIVDTRARMLVSTTANSTGTGTGDKPWTFHATGTLFFRPATISELFIGEFHTDAPNTALRSVASAVFDSRSGTPITWDNLFTDKQKGLSRLISQTNVTLPRPYRPSPSKLTNPDALAANEIASAAWIPTGAGIELHFAGRRSSRCIPLITIPWAQVADLIAPKFLPIIS